VSTDCDAVRRAIEGVDFRGWQGIPEECRPQDLFPELPDDPSYWGVRPLGEDYLPSSFHVLGLPGYYRPTVSVRDGELTLFDGMNPEFELPPVLEELGEPDARLDYQHGTLPVNAGEWVFPGRGITLFLNTTSEVPLHVALYRPTDLDGYASRLRPHLGKRLRPRPIS
jgi:hypothetical protein